LVEEIDSKVKMTEKARLNDKEMGKWLSGNS
jgi:hypothetical protein